MHYNIHHNQPIHVGGGVFDVDNMTVVSPRMHEEILSKMYHLGR